MTVLELTASRIWLVHQGDRGFKTLASTHIFWPSQIIQLFLDLFQDIAEPLFKKKQANATESKSLEALKDTLLPKLILGELTISSAEKVAMEAV